MTTTELSPGDLDDLVPTPTRGRRSQPLRVGDGSITVLAGDEYGINEVPATVPADRQRPRPAIDRRDPGDGRRVRALDGLRGLALLMVIAFHEGWLRGGFIGVDVFFVVSGYVITRTLLPGAPRRARLGAFWARRVRRLVPAMLLLVLGAQVWVRLGAPASQWGLLNGQTRAALGYLSNWYAIVHHTGYWEAGAQQTPLVHLWSLAVEEQFYFVWPLLLLGALRLGRGRVRPWMVRATVGLAALSMVAVPFVYEAYGADRAYYGTDTRVGLILLGAFLALRGARDTEASSKRSRVRRHVVRFSVVWLGAATVLFTTHAPGLYWGGQALIGLATLVVVATVVGQPCSPLGRVLAKPVLVWIGVRSYGMYLWSWPVHTVLTSSRTGVQGPLLLIVKLTVLLMLTQLSYHLVELPIRRGRLPGRRLVVTLVTPCLVIGSLSLVLQPNPPAQMTRGVLLASGSGGTGSLRILVVGDSWARNVGAGVSLADESRRDTVLNDGMPACGIHALPTLSGGRVRQVPADCARWQARWADDVSTFQPDAVLLVTGRWDQAATNIDGRFVRPDDRSFQLRYGRQLDTAIATLGRGGAPVYVATVVDNPIPAERVWSTAMNTMLENAVPRNRGAHLLDLHAMLCTKAGCPSRLQGAAVYDDTLHLTPRWQRLLGRRLRDLLHRDVAASIPEVEARARESAATRLLPTPSDLLGGAAAVSVSYPKPAEMSASLLGGARPGDLALTAQTAAVTATAVHGDVVGAVALRFSEDYTPDRLAVDAVRTLEAQGWSSVPLPVYNRVILVKGSAVRLLVRMNGGLTVVDVPAGVRSIPERTRSLVRLAELLIARQPAAA